MTVYVLDFSDPLKSGFTVNPGSYNGPGSTTPQSSLRMYGRGALEWGEAVNENQLRLSENFAGATPPVYPIEGQSWFAVELYWYETGVNWHRYDYNTETWSVLLPDFTGNVTPATPAIGQYWFTGGAPTPPYEPNTLYRWDTLYQQAAPAWLERVRTDNPVAPVNGVDFPKQTLRVWNGRDEWVSVQTTISTSMPSGPTLGQFWYDPLNNQLWMWDGAAWVSIPLGGGGPVGGDIDMDGTYNLTNLPITGTGTNNAIGIDQADSRYVDVAGDTLAGNLDMDNTYTIINLIDPVNPQDAMTLNYADNNYLNVDGDTMTAGFLTLFQDPTLPMHAATANYVDTQIAAAVTGGGFATVNAFANNTTVVAFTPGQIYVDTAAPRIYIATGTGSNSPALDPTNWKQVWPAQYS